MRFGKRRPGALLLAATLVLSLTPQLLADVREVRLAVKGAT
jgi:hypothetical protein